MFSIDVLTRVANIMFVGGLVGGVLIIDRGSRPGRGNPKMCLIGVAVTGVGLLCGLGLLLAAFALQ